MTTTPDFLLALEEAFNAAMISNDVARISRCTTEEWILVTPEAGPIPGARILDAIRTGRLTHATMTKQPMHARVLGDVAWVVGRGQNTGTYLGAPMSADEYVTDVYQRQRDGGWRCVLTHLTPVKPPR